MGSKQPPKVQKPNKGEPQPCDEAHPLHDEPGEAGRVDTEPRGIGKPIGQPDDFGRI